MILIVINLFMCAIVAVNAYILPFPGQFFFNACLELWLDRLFLDKCIFITIEQLRGDIILLQLPESFSLLFSCANKGYRFLNLSGINKIK